MVARCLVVCVKVTCLKIEMCTFCSWNASRKCVLGNRQGGPASRCQAMTWHDGTCGYVGCPSLGLSLMSHLHPWIQKENGLPSGVMRKALGDFPNIHPGLGTLKGTGTHASSSSLCFSALFKLQFLPAWAEWLYKGIYVFPRWVINICKYSWKLW